MIIHLYIDTIYEHIHMAKHQLSEITLDLLFFSEVSFATFHNGNPDPKQELTY